MRPLSFLFKVFVDQDLPQLEFLLEHMEADPVAREHRILEFLQADESRLEQRGLVLQSLYGPDVIDVFLHSANIRKKQSLEQLVHVHLLEE